MTATATATVEQLFVGPTELRAWARASHDLAVREGFPLKAAEIRRYIVALDEWPAGHTVALVPRLIALDAVTLANAIDQAIADNRDGITVGPVTVEFRWSDAWRRVAASIQVEPASVTEVAPVDDDRVDRRAVVAILAAFKTLYPDRF